VIRTGLPELGQLACPAVMFSSSTRLREARSSRSVDQGSARVRLADFGLRPRERFLYEYDFSPGWQHDARVERLLPLQPGRTYPICVGGRRAVPPEDCGGPWAFLGLRQRYSPMTIASRLADLFEGGAIDDHRNSLSCAAGVRRHV
jgi:hypothetical protein